MPANENRASSFRRSLKDGVLPLRWPTSKGPRLAHAHRSIVYNEQARLASKYLVPKRLPSKLERVPLLDAVCELRIDSSMELHNVVPGQLLVEHASPLSIDQMPAGGLPQQLRANIPGLLDAPLVRIHFDHYLVLCGRASVAVACKLPYPGWSAFKPQICSIFKTVLKLPVVRSIQRYSVKYVNLVEEKDLNDQFKLLDWKLSVGEHEVRSGSVQLRCEVSGPDDMVTNLQISTGGIAQVPNVAEQKYGAVVDADTVKPYKTTDINKFKEELETRLDSVHSENKKWVFESLRQSTIDAMGPTYDE